MGCAIMPAQSILTWKGSGHVWGLWGEGGWSAEPWKESDYMHDDTKKSIRKTASNLLGNIRAKHGKRATI